MILRNYHSIIFTIGLVGGFLQGVATAYYGVTMATDYKQLLWFCHGDQIIISTTAMVYLSWRVLIYEKEKLSWISIILTRRCSGLYKKLRGCYGCFYGNVLGGRHGNCYYWLGSLQITSEKIQRLWDNLGLWYYKYCVRFVQDLINDVNNMTLLLLPPGHK